MILSHNNEINLACPIPEKTTRGATGTKSGDFNEKDSNLGPLPSEANVITIASFDFDYLYQSSPRRQCGTVFNQSLRSYLHI